MMDGNRAVGAATVPIAGSLFDRVPAVYAFCREHLFRDDTDRIAQTLWPDARPPCGAVVIELGCGPGFYSRRLASRFEHLQMIGVDRSSAQLERARARAADASLANCRFDVGDAAALPYPDETADAVVSARLLTVVEDREQVLAEVHRVLRPGGRCFVAEPTSALRAALPIAAMRLAACLGGSKRDQEMPAVDRVEVLSRARFARLVRREPWQRVSQWAEASYQYALLEKAGEGPR